MCYLFYACNWDQVSILLAGAATFGLFAILFIGLVLVGIEYERAKRTGIDVGQIDKIIDDARRRAYRRGLDEK